MPTAPITLTAHYRITETPPRCRTPRPIHHTHTARFEIPTTTSTHAPSLWADTTAHTPALRVHNGKTYRPINAHTMTIHQPTTPYTDPHPANHLALWASELLIIDGRTHQEDPNHATPGWYIHDTDYGAHASAGFQTHPTQQHRFITAASGETAARAALTAWFPRAHTTTVDPAPWNPAAITALHQPRPLDRATEALITYTRIHDLATDALAHLTLHSPSAQMSHLEDTIAALARAHQDARALDAAIPHD